MLLYKCLIEFNIIGESKKASALQVSFCCISLNNLVYNSILYTLYYREGEVMMKKIISSLLVLLILSTTLIIPNKVQASSAWINETKVSVYKGGTYNLEIYGTSKKVTWSSADKTIVKVNKNGVITGVSNGKAIIKAKIGKNTYSCTVTVKDKVKYDIEINGKNIKVTYTPNFGFEELQPVITYYDKDGNELGKSEFTNTKVAKKGVEMIDEKKLPDFKYSYYEIEFISE